MDQHFVEMLTELSAAGAEYLVIGAHAVAAHGHLRGTRDIDIWVRPTKENAARVWQALVRFGAPLRDVKPEDFATPDNIYQIGVDPIRIDILTSPAGLDFQQAWPNRIYVGAKGTGHSFPFLGREDLLRSKRATGRLQDLADADALERQS